MLAVSDQEFARVVARNVSIAGVLRDLRRPVVGASYRLIRKEVFRMGLDTSHWKGKAHGTSPQPQKVPWSEVLVENSTYPLNSRRKGALVREGLVENRCVECGLETEWNNKPLVLRLDHINGVRDDHQLENLRMLCPNCDSQTDTYCGRNARKPPNRCSCGKIIGRRSKSCLKCFPRTGTPQPTKIEWPPMDELLSRARQTGLSALGRELGISDNAIRKRMRNRGVTPPGRNT